MGETATFKANERIPTRPLSYENVDLGMPKELIIDYTTAAVYISDENREIVDFTTAVAEKIEEDPEISDKIHVIDPDTGEEISINDAVDSLNDKIIDATTITDPETGVTITLKDAISNVDSRVTDLSTYLDEQYTKTSDLPTVARTGSYTDLLDKPTIPSASDTTPKAPGNANKGSEEQFARGDHIHPLQTTISGNAGSATKLETARMISLSGVTSTPQAFDGSADIAIPVTSVPATLVETDATHKFITDTQLASNVAADDIEVDVPVSWGGTDPSTQTISVSGMTSDMIPPIIDIIHTGNFESEKQQDTDWGKIYKITTGNGSITLYATEAPTVALKIRIRKFNKLNTL